VAHRVHPFSSSNEKSMEFFTQGRKGKKSTWGRKRVSNVSRGDHRSGTVEGGSIKRLNHGGLSYPADGPNSLERKKERYLHRDVRKKRGLLSVRQRQKGHGGNHG